MQRTDSIIEQPPFHDIHRVSRFLTLSLYVLLMPMHARGQDATPLPPEHVSGIWQKAYEPVGPADWQARWIWYDDGRDAVNRYALARRTFRLDTVPESARLSITADDTYRLWLNGRYIARGPARCIPEQQSFDTFDITAALRNGPNILAVLAYHSGTTTPYHVRGRPGLLVQMELTFADSTMITGTDAAWRMIRGHAWNTGTQQRREGSDDGRFTEAVDFRRYPHGWETPDFDDTSWPAAVELSRMRGWPPNIPPDEPRAVMRPWTALVPRELPYLTETRISSRAIAQQNEVIEFHKLSGTSNDPALNMAQDIVAPIEYCRIDNEAAWQTGTGRLEILNSSRVDTIVQRAGIRSPRLVFDLGDSFNGYPFIRLSGDPGTIVDLAYAAFLVDGQVAPTFMNMRNADRIILSGKTDDWEAVDWQRCRYIAVTLRNSAGPVRIEDIGVRAVQYPFPAGGSLTIPGEPELTRLWHMAANTIRAVTTDAYMDNYRERLQYSQTSYYAARANYAAFGDTRLQRRYLRQMPFSMWVDGIMAPCAPSDLQNASPNQEYRPSVWLESNTLWISGLRDYLRYSGDLQTTRELLPALDRLLSRLTDLENPDGLLDTPPYYYWIDHANIDRRGINFHINAFYLMALDDAAEIYQALGLAHGEQLHDRADSLRRRIREALWDSGRGLFADALAGGRLTGRYSEHANFLALSLDIATPEQVRSIIRHCFEKPADDIVQVSPLFMYYVCEGLFRAGHGRQAIQILKDRFRPMLEWDLGTLWEDWSLTASKRSGSWLPHARSSCQAESAFPCYTLSRWLLGVDPLTVTDPILEIRYHDCGLGHISGIIPTPDGLLSIEWRTGDTTQMLHITIPPGKQARVHLTGFAVPTGNIRIDGKPAGTLETLRQVVLDSGAHTVEAGNP